MSQVIFVEHNGEEHVVEAEEGANLMEVALDHDIEGIDADCGGNCACATCHVYVDEDQVDRLGERAEREQTMLDNAEQVRPTSRLACQLTVFDGIRVTMPEQQF